MKCSIDELADAIAKELAAYSQDVTDGLKADVKAVAKECKNEIQANSPYQTGDYKKGWAVKNNFENKYDIRQTVNNRTDYQLTHLLEYGHAGRGGTGKGAAPSYPHIAPAQENAEKKLLNKVRVRVKG